MTMKINRFFKTVVQDKKDYKTYCAIWKKFFTDAEFDESEKELLSIFSSVESSYSNKDIFRKYGKIDCWNLYKIMKVEKQLLCVDDDTIKAMFIGEPEINSAVVGVKRWNTPFQLRKLIASYK